MPRRKKRQPVRRNDSDSAESNPTSSKRARREEEDELSVVDRGFQLIKCLGLNDQLWQPAAVILDSVRLYSDVIRIHLAEGAVRDATTVVHIGRVYLLCDVAGISNILNDSVHTTSVELRLRFNRDKRYLQVTAITPSNPRPVILLSEVVMSVREDTIISPEVTSCFIKSRFHLHLAVDSITSVVPLLVTADQKVIESQGTGHCSLPDTNRVHTTSNLLKLLFPSVLNQDNLSVTQSSQRTIFRLSITEQILKFYQDVKTCQKSQSVFTVPLVSPIPHLTAVLLNYQVDAVQWMLGRETEAVQNMNHSLHFLWRKIRGPTEDTPDSLYYNPFSGVLTSTHYTMPLPPRGGILADEMGLGKTVEILALILSHTWSGNQASVQTVSVKLEEGSTGVEELGSASSQQSRSSRCHGEKIWCVCGADDEGAACDVQCQECRAWQHSFCVDYGNSGDQGYTCVRCLLKQPRPCGATLIIVPNTLLPQWLEEIDKHTDSSALSVLVYEGVAVRYQNPLHLARQDIVMVSYETLRKELDRVHHHEFSGILRHQKRYTYPPSPLLALCWWRVCLDEAQTVETTNAKAAEMTHKLTAINRWCVTGTPIQRTLGDLYGLVYFLDHAPYCVRQWYDHLAWQPYLKGDHTPILELFAKLMWRNTKEDVADELVLPEQSEKIHWLSFSAVEAYYYNRQREMCSKTFSEVVSRLEYDADITDLSRSFINKLMAPLHSLRQACCHPQLVRGGYIPFSAVNKRYITMDELLKKLEMQAMVEGREHLRLLVMSLNGIAAIHILQEEWQLAVDTYREAMSCWAEQEGRFDCDKLQRIHTMENLYWLVQQEHSSLTSDDQLDSKAAELRRLYLNKADLSLKAQVEVLLSTIHASSDIKAKALEKMKVYLSKDDEGRENDEDVAIEEEEEVSESQEDEERPTQISTDGENDEERPAQDGENDEERPAQDGENDEERPAQDGENDEERPAQDGENDEERPAQDGENDEERPAQDGENDEERPAQDGENDEERPAQTSEDGEIRQMQNEDGHNVISWDTELLTNQKLGLFSSQPWWVHAIALIREKDKEAFLIYAVNSEVTNSAVSIRDLNGLQLWLSLQADKIERARSELLIQLGCLAAPETPSPHYVADVCDCHLKKGRVRTTNQCDLCLFETDLQGYASLVFQNYSFRDEEDISRRQGIFETALGVLYSAIKKESPILVEAGKLHLACLENARKEFKHMQSVWMAAEFRVRTCDELAMAAKRLRLATEEEEITGALDLDAVYSYELWDKMMSFKQDVSFAKRSLGKAVGQLGYLHNLSIANGTDDKESCPICCGELIDRWVVFPCSHSMCLECTYKLMKLHAPSGSIVTILDFPPNRCFNCPLCRKSIMSQQVNFIQATANSLSNESTAVNVKGSHSTKITAIVTTLSTLRQEDPTAKSLVFSSNYEVLKLISKALDDNEIPYVFVVQKTDFQQNLKDFKSSSSINVALMQLSSGSKGLNIVEATHVLLVEPSLNIGSEQQAIGRVHRVGQTKPTTVHRYYIRDTVEAKIKELLTNTVKIDKFISGETSCPLSVTELRSLLQ